jgi:hypothetical protein
MAKHLVAIADILGFTSLVSREPASELAERVYEIVELANAHKEKTWDVSSAGADLVSGSTTVEMLHFSDTLLFWSDAPDPTNHSTADTHILSFTRYVADIAFYAFLRNLPLRVGFAFGDLFADRARGIVVGQAVVDAYATEQAQEWIGGAFHSSYPYPSHCGVRYDVPIKPGYPRLERALEWFSAALPGGSFWGRPGEPFHRAFRDVLKRAVDRESPTSVHTKYRNTSQFFDSRVESMKGRVYVGGKRLEWNDW